MRLTDRDRLTLQWINGHSFVAIQQAATWMKVGYETCRHRLGLLVKAGYLKRKRFEHLGPLMHWLTREGGQVAGELELSLKAADRLRDIVTDYAVDRRFHGVWYAVTNQAVRRVVERTVKPCSGFTILNWERAA